MILHICRIVETLVTKTDGIDEKDFVIKSLDNVFKLSNKERKLIGEFIEFLHSNELIEAVKLTKKLLYGAGDWLK
jgi:hypothetical protein